MVKIELRNIEIDKIRPNPKQPRKKFDKEKLDQLANSIKQVGLVQPIIIEEKEPNKFEIISGERRWKAHNKVGMKKVLSLVKRYDADLQKKKELLAANQHRENLEDYEEWNYIKDIAKAEGWVHKEGQYAGEINLSSVQAEMGILRGRLEMLKSTFEGTDKELQKAVKEGKITTSDAQTISSLDKNYQNKIAREALASEEGMRRSEIREKVKEIKREELYGDAEQPGVYERTARNVTEELNDWFSTGTHLINELVKEMNVNDLKQADKNSLITSIGVLIFNTLPKISRILIDNGAKADKKIVELMEKTKEK